MRLSLRRPAWAIAAAVTASRAHHRLLRRPRPDAALRRLLRQPVGVVGDAIRPVGLHLLEAVALRGRVLGVDLRNPKGPPTWAIEMMSAIPQSRITLTWPDMSALPPDAKSLLVYQHSETRTFRRTSVCGR